MTLAVAAVSYSSDDAHWCGRIPTTCNQKGGFNDTSLNIFAQLPYKVNCASCSRKMAIWRFNWTQFRSSQSQRQNILVFCRVLAHVTIKVKTSAGPWYLWSATPCVFPGCCSFIPAVRTSVFAVLSDYLNFTAFNGSSEIKVHSSGRWGNKLHLSY